MKICRQAAVLDAGARVVQETRHWNEEGYTVSGRIKETAEDYRYFPEPDLVPVVCEPQWVEQLRANLLDCRRVDVHVLLSNGR